MRRSFLRSIDLAPAGSRPPPEDLMRRSHLVLLSLVFLAVALPLVLIAAEPMTRSVYVTVVDDKGQPVAGLTPADFGLKEGGKDREIASAEPAKAKIHLALMVEETLTPQGGVRQGLFDFIQRMIKTSEIAMIVVGQRNSTAVDYTTDANALTAGINNFSLSQADRQTMVPEGIFDLAKIWEKEKPARPVMVLVAFEKQQASTEEPQNVLNQLARSRAQLFVVSTEGGGSVSTTAASNMDMAGRSQVMGDGSKQSGGRRVEVSTLTGFPKGLQQVADDLSAQYLLTYTLPDGVKPSDRLAVTLKKKGAVLRAPTKVSDK
jgi:VWFA-related protein